MKKRLWRPSRRGVLRGLVGGSLVTLGLPWLEQYAYASDPIDEGFPKRLILWVWGNGTRPEKWTPMGDGSTWELSEELAPLDPWKSKITVCSGFSLKLENLSAHWSGAIGLLTGQQINGVDGDWTVAGPTLDQLVASTIGGQTVYPSLQIGISTGNVLSYSGPNQQNFGETDPLTLYNRLFGGDFVPAGETGEVSPTLGWRKRVLDAVIGDAHRLRSTLGSADQERLDRHLEGISSLEDQISRLQDNPPASAACSRPAAPDANYPPLDGCPQIDGIHAAMSSLLAMSLACDQTRVVMIQSVRPQEDTLFPGATAGHHFLTHTEPGDQPQVHAITTSLMADLGDLLGALDAIPEGSGTLLDHSIVMACSETGDARIHSMDEIPVVLAGGGSGALKMGLHVRSYTKENVGKIALSVLRAMDVPAEQWGKDSSEVQDGLSEIEG